MWTGVLVAAIVLGSRNLQNFDPALVIYTFAIIFATWGVIYHYSVWIRKPPTYVYWQRGWQLFKEQGVIRSFVHIVGLAGTHLLAQTFIASRSRMRWAMHQLIFWGCMLAVMITFPLVFGWIHFTSAPNDQMTYVTHLFGYPAFSFRLHTFTALILFHGLDISAFLVLGGIALSLWRRMRDEGARAVQTFAMDFWPLDPALCNIYYRPGSDGFAGLARRQFLRFHRHFACHHGDCRSALSSVRKVLPHLSTTGATRRETVPAGGRRRVRAQSARVVASATPLGCTSMTWNAFCHRSASTIRCLGQ